jgi:hypothetical protein
MLFFNKLKIRKVVGGSMQPFVINGSIAFFAVKKNYYENDIVLLRHDGRDYLKKIANINTKNKIRFVSEDFFGLDSRVWGDLNKEVIEAKLLYTVKPILIKNRLNKIFTSK